MAVKFTFESPFFVRFRTHYCPKCGKVVALKKKKKVVNSRSEEAKNFDFSSGDTNMIGDVKFVWYTFFCNQCNAEIAIREMKKYEFQLKKRGIRIKKIPIKYMYKANPIYVHLKKHYCPQCKSTLDIKYTSEIVNSDSSNAGNYDFTTPDSRLHGDVEFRKSYFHCQNCNFNINFDEMRKLEKSKKNDR